MNPKFSLEKLPAAIRRESAGLPIDRFFRVVDRRGYQFVCGYKTELIEFIRTGRSSMSGDVHHEIKDDEDTALKLLELDMKRAVDLLKEVVKHVADGHYNDVIIERLRKICEAEKWHTAESILASVPPRQSHGPIEEWAMHAIQLFCEMRMSIYQKKNGSDSKCSTTLTDRLH